MIEPSGTVRSTDKFSKIEFSLFSPTALYLQLTNVAKNKTRINLFISKVPRYEVHVNFQIKIS